MRTALRPARSLPQAVCPLSWLPGLCEGPQHGDTAPRAEGRPAVPANHTAARRMGTCGLLKSCMLCFRNQRARPTSCCSCGRGAAAPAAPNPPGLAHPAPPHAPPPHAPPRPPRPAPAPPRPTPHPPTPRAHAPPRPAHAPLIPLPGSAYATPCTPPPPRPGPAPPCPCPATPRPRPGTATPH